VSTRRDGRRARARGARPGRRIPWIPLGGVAAVAVLVYFLLNSFDVFNAVGERVPAQATAHVAEGSSVRYNSDPPSSGQHWPAPARWGFESEAIPDERAVHNLEHGGIVIGFNGLPDAQLNAVRSFADRYPPSGGARRAKILIAPDQRAPSGGLLVRAWGWRDRLDAYDEARLRAFIDAHIGRCCENVP
jgi:hypothetical protein